MQANFSLSKSGEQDMVPVLGEEIGRVEFPPMHLSEEIDLSSLVHHAGSLAYDTPLEQTEQAFREAGVDYMALVREERVIGICSRRQVGILLGARFGFALHSRSPAWHAQVRKPLVFERGTPVRSVLANAMARQGEGFHEDVALVDESHSLLGLIPAERIAHVQTRLVSEQVISLRRQYADLLEVHEALRKAQGLWLGLFESNLLGVALVDAKGNLQAINPCCEELLNLQALPDSLRNVELLLSDKGGCALDEILPIGRPGDTIRRILPLRVPGRGLRHFQIAAAWISETGQVCICFDDITDRRLLDQKMKQQEKQMLFETLVAGIAHELNNKLTPVLGFSELLDGCKDETLRRTYLHCIGKSVTEAAGIIRQLLQLSKPETGTKAKVDLREIVEETLVMLKFQLRQARVETQIEIPPNPVLAHADSGQLKQVLMNLAINAIHAMEGRESPLMRLSLTENQEGICMLVEDNGSGIPAGIIDRIFDPFFTTKAPDRGTGLGLSVCMSIVRQHGGGIEVESEPQKGTRFRIMLPCFKETAERVKEDALVGREPAAQVALGRVLVVDDEESVRRLLGILISECFSCRVDTAGNGREALLLCRETSYDMIVSDIRMPVMDGEQFLRELQELSPGLARRFVFITGNAEVRAWVNDRGGRKIPALRKPFTREDLTRVCQDLLRGSTLAA